MQVMGYRTDFFKAFPHGCDKWGFKRSDGWYECHRCGRRMRSGDPLLDIDHIKPQRVYREDGRPVNNDVTNLAASCIPCNRGKGRDEYDFTDWTHKQVRQMFY